ncbi:MAG: muconolactone Delta-isomerase family protein [Candidatus Bathyarchaeia archaeon]
MKFLVIATSRESLKLPPEQALKLIMAEYQVGKQLLKEGKMEEVYLLAGLKGGMLIGEAESGAELNAMMTRMPLYDSLDIQIYPLMTLDEGIAQVKQGLEFLKAQK